MPTYFDLEVRPPAESWRLLRRLRANPPVPPASSVLRRHTFQAALEQAEQQFRAAASVSYESRALNLYYGLSQAGRAIAAGASTLTGNDWTLSGHGLRCSNLPDVAKDVATLSVRPHSGAQTSFQRLSQALQSPIPTIAELYSVWPNLIETTMNAPLGDVAYAPMFLTMGSRFPSDGVIHVEANVALPLGIMSMTISDRPSLPDFLDRYPGLVGWVTHRPDGHAVDWPPQQSLSLQWPLGATTSTDHWLRSRVTRYRSHDLVVPTIGSLTQPVHPLMAWWIVLYVLSMATRYQPAEWTIAVDVNRSAQATAIEFVLDCALSSVPELLVEAVEFVQ